MTRHHTTQCLHMETLLTGVPADQPRFLRALVRLMAPQQGSSVPGSLYCTEGEFEKTWTDSAELPPARSVSDLQA